MTRRLLPFLLALLLLLLPLCSAEAWTAKYDLHFKRWGEFYWPWTDWKHWKAQGTAESELDPFARSPVGAMSIMQLMPKTAAEMGVLNPYDPESSIQGGIKYDRWLLRYWKQIPDADEQRDFIFGSYNAGAGNILKAHRRAGKPNTWEETAAQLPAITGKHAAETTGYVRRIRRLYEAIR